jgi:hypothetical protein
MYRSTPTTISSIRIVSKINIGVGIGVGYKAAY